MDTLLTPSFPSWTSTQTPLDVKHVPYCDGNPFRAPTENGKVWIPIYSITTIYLTISPAEHPTDIYKDESGRRRSTPLDVKSSAGRQLDSKLARGPFRPRNAMKDKRLSTLDDHFGMRQ